jgi:pre-mRNA-processing factor 6
VHSIGFEQRQGNTKAAELLLSKALQLHSENGQLLALAVELAPRKEKKTQLAVGFERNSEAPELLLSAALVFWHEGKMEKARVWFEKLVGCFPVFGDGWLSYYAYLKKTDSLAAEDLERRVDCFEVSRGTAWKKARKRARQASNSIIMRGLA